MLLLVTEEIPAAAVTKISSLIYGIRIGTVACISYIERAGMV